MANITDAMVFDMIQKVDREMTRFEKALGEVRSELVSLRGAIHTIGGDILNIYAKIARHDEQLDRIKNRLDLRELAEAQARFKHD